MAGTQRTGLRPHGAGDDRPRAFHPGRDCRCVCGRRACPRDHPGKSHVGRGGRPVIPRDAAIDARRTRSPIDLGDARTPHRRHRLRHAAAPCPPLAPATNEPGLGDILRQLQAQLIPGSTVSLISDFIDLDAADRPVLLQLATDNRLHAIHIHEKSDCSSDDGKSTGGHWNPTGTSHGKWGSPDGFHKGDIGNLTADENGKATVTLKTDLWCVGCQDDTKNVVGKAIIVHSGEDDFTTQPTGAAGGRISCGGIIR